MPFTRRQMLRWGVLASGAGAATLPAGQVAAAPAELPAAAQVAKREPLPLRMILENLPHPFWYEDPARGNPGAPKSFWDQGSWARRFANIRDSHYNAVLYWCDPWMVHQWQTWLIRHKDHPEARELPAEKQEALIKQIGWIFRQARETGLKNILINMSVITTPAFARAHGLDRKLPESETVDWRHNHQHFVPMYHFGVRNELTCEFTVNAIAELFQTYPELDGLFSEMGEALPGRRSTWYKEAIVPGFRKSGRTPLSIVNNWMTPLDEFLVDIAPKEVYENTWVAVEHNGEIICDVDPDPIALRWPRQSGLPTVVMYLAHNVSVLPFNSPKFAHELIRGTQRIDHCQGFASYLMDSLITPNQDLFAKALAYYGAHEEPYSDDRWVAVLVERFKEEGAARHFLNAYNISGRITPAMNMIAWQPHDAYCPHQLILKYWHWTDQDVRYTHFTAASQGATLLPVKHYARVVAERGEGYRDNNGSDFRRHRSLKSGSQLPGHPGAQELIWGHIDYQVTPEAHMRSIRKMGEECLQEAEQGMKTVKSNKDQAERLLHYMKAYQLLTAYYEHKVLTAISALIHHYAGLAEERARAEKLADETVELYVAAANHIYEQIDKREGKIKGRWWDGERDMPGLIEAEKKDRNDIPELFRWAKAAKA